MVIEVWVLIGGNGEILGVTINKSISNAWRSTGGRVEELSKEIDLENNLKGRVGQDAV
jgi:hypothetical protein